MNPQQPPVVLRHDPGGGARLRGCHEGSEVGHGRRDHRRRGADRSDAGGRAGAGGVGVEILERRTTPELVGTRARGFHSRTIEIFDQRGIADRFLAEGRTAQALSFGGTPLDVAGLPTRHPYTLGLGRATSSGSSSAGSRSWGCRSGEGWRSAASPRTTQGVDVHLAGGEPLRTGYLVGADGGRSVVRQAAGIDFVGAEATRSHLIAEVRVSEETPTGIRLDEVGIHAMNVLEDGRTVGMVVTEQRLGPATEPTLADLGEALTAVYGTDFGIHDPVWISRFTDATRQAAGYRQRAGAARRRRRAHPPADRRSGHRPRRAGRGQPRLEARPGRPGGLPRRPPGQLRSGAAPGHGARPAERDGPGAAPAGGRADRGDARHDLATCWASTDRAPSSPGCCPGSTCVTTSGRGTPCSAAAFRTSTWSPPTGRGASSSCSTTPGPCCSSSPRPEPRPRRAGHLDLAPWADRVLRVRAEHTGTWELPVIGTVPAPAPSWSGPTATWPGWATRPGPGSPTP